MLTDNELKQIVVEALLKVYRSHRRLGERGLKIVGINPLGENSLLADDRAEEIVISTLKEHRVPITIVSEEHPTIELGTDFLAVLDGLDGTNRYIARMRDGDENARYGTMLGIFRGAYPRYEDYIVSGIMEHPTRRLVIASRGEGITLIDSATRKETSVHEPFKSGLNPNRIRADTYSKAKHIHFVEERYIKSFPEIDLRSSGISLQSSAAHYTDFALGEADRVYENTRKHNLEIAVAYALVRERGGVIVSEDGKDIGPQKYFEFHYDPDDYAVVISGPSEDALRPEIQRISKS